MSQIEHDLQLRGIVPKRWELEVLARGATVTFGSDRFSYCATDEWDDLYINWS